MRYKTGGAWEAVPTAAMYGTHTGSAQVVWPAATGVNGLGEPCAAIGRPEIVIQTAWLQDSGMAFWRAFFGAVTDLDASIEIEIFDPRAGADTMYAGLLHWPTFGSVGRGAGATTTIYRDVRIVISDCEATA